MNLSDYREFHHDCVMGITVDSWTTNTHVQVLSVPDMQAGKYLVTLSVLFSTPDTNDYVNFLYSSDDGSIDPIEFRVEAKDADDHVPLSFPFVVCHAGGLFSIHLDALLESGGLDATIIRANIIIDQKGECVAP